MKIHGLLWVLLCTMLYAQQFDYLPQGRNVEVVAHTYFTLSYIEEYEQPEWVAYRLTDSMPSGEFDRKNDFRSDPKVKTGSPHKDDFGDDTYDRGHLCPAEDMSFSAEAISETFYMSNMSPQAGAFNRGIWKQLEEKVRDFARRDTELFVVAGGILHGNMLTVGTKNKVSVPNAYYKVLLDYHGPEKKAIAFIFPNEKCKQPLISYAVSIDSVEKVTGIDFFPKLPDRIEKKLEAQCDPQYWGFLTAKKSKAKKHD